MVVVGVAGELAVNLRVSLIENAWEISQLPRDLSDTQAIAIAEKLVPFKGMHFDLAMHQDLEPMRLLDKVENALILAGWQEAPPPPGITLFERGNRPHVAIRTMAGIWIQ